MNSIVIRSFKECSSLKHNRTQHVHRQQAQLSLTSQSCSLLGIVVLSNVYKEWSFKVKTEHIVMRHHQSPIPPKHVGLTWCITPGHSCTPLTCIRCVRGTTFVSELLTSYSLLYEFMLAFKQRCAISLSAFSKTKSERESIYEVKSECLKYPDIVPGSRGVNNVPCPVLFPQAPSCMSPSTWRSPVC